MEEECILYIMANGTDILVVDNLDDVFENLNLMEGYVIYGWVHDFDILGKMIKEAEINKKGVYHGWDNKKGQE